MPRPRPKPRPKLTKFYCKILRIEFFLAFMNQANKECTLKKCFNFLSQNTFKNFNFLSHKDFVKCIIYSKYYFLLVSVSVSIRSRIFSRNRIVKNGRIFGFGLGRYREFPITNADYSIIIIKIETKFQFSKCKETSAILS